MKEALAVIAQAPLAGQVKTRLHGILTPEEATDLYVALLSDTFALMEAAQEEREDLSLVLCYTPEGEEEAFERVEREGSLMLPQQGEGLSERLSHCFADLFDAGFEAVVVLGANCPTLLLDHLLEAFEQLDGEDKVVAGPTADGGYYLIGMRRPQIELFEGINWSTGRVLAEIQERAQALNLELRRLPEWYDVDTPEEFERLRVEVMADKDAADHTHRFFKSWLKARQSPKI